MFHTEDETAHIEKITDYVDPKGEKAVGLAINISITMGPEALDLFELGLCAGMYRRPDVIASQQQPDANLTARFDLFDKLAAKQKIVGATIDLSAGGDLVTLAQRAHLPGATVDRIKIHLMKTGIEIRARMLVWPDAAGISAIYAMRKSAILLTITPPEAEGYEDDDHDDEDERQGDMLDDNDDHAESEADPLASAVLSGGDEPAQSSATVTHRRRRKVDRAFPDAADGTASTAQDALAGA